MRELTSTVSKTPLPRRRRPSSLPTGVRSRRRWRWLPRRPLSNLCVCECQRTGSFAFTPHPPPWVDEQSVCCRGKHAPSTGKSSNSSSSSSRFVLVGGFWAAAAAAAAVGSMSLVFVGWSLVVGTLELPPEDILDVRRGGWGG